MNKNSLLWYIYLSYTDYVNKYHLSSVYIYLFVYCLADHAIKNLMCGIIKSESEPNFR